MSDYIYVSDADRLKAKDKRIAELEGEILSFGRGFEKEIKRLKVSLAGATGAVSKQHKDIEALRREKRALIAEVSRKDIALRTIMRRAKSEYLITEKPA